MSKGIDPVIGMMISGLLEQSGKCAPVFTREELANQPLVELFRNYTLWTMGLDADLHSTSDVLWDG